MGGQRATKRRQRGAAPVLCTCRGGPTPVATFRNEQLVSVVRMHWRGRDHCTLPDEPQDLATWHTEVTQ